MTREAARQQHHDLSDLKRGLSLFELLPLKFSTALHLFDTFDFPQTAQRPGNGDQ
jgi:hypothetical protein